ncbi:MAG: acetyl-CoA carboxylase biotin carboxyl carrier protein [Calditrichaeota bacterium]|nr:MAG: acetyl-CoA carboxylase biotin carboxyl carrier protein [Calditrichota bacterium]
MDIQSIKQLIKIVEKSDIDELELIEEGKKIRISKNSKGAASQVVVNGSGLPQYSAPAPPPPPQAPATAPDVETEAEKKAVSESEKYYEVRSPMVGTFYRAPAPDADPYVEVGDVVSVGTTLCIIEAMKLMNEIQSEYNGRIAKILVENAQPVEYNQVLFLIEKV